MSVDLEKQMRAYTISVMWQARVNMVPPPSQSQTLSYTALRAGATAHRPLALPAAMPRPARRAVRSSDFGLVTAPHM